MTDPQAALDRLVAKAGPFYTLPAVAMRVVALTDDARVDTRALKDCIENDPALTGKILSVVNSSLFGLSRQVSDLNQALALLGTKPLKLLVLGFSLPPALFQGADSAVLQRYWQRSLTKAVASRQLSERIWSQPGDEAFIAGLLQDVGVLLLIRELGGPYLRLLERAAADGSDLGSLERSSMGFDHLAVSARLFAQWGLPESLRAVVALEGEAAESTIREIVSLAELAARWLVDGQVSSLRLLLSTETAGHGRIAAGEIESLLKDLEAKMLALTEVFHLPAFAPDDARDLVVRAHAQLAAVASDTFGALSIAVQSHPSSTEEDDLLGGFRELADAVARAAHHAPAKAVAVDAPPPERRADAAEPHVRPCRSQMCWETGNSALLDHLKAAVASARSTHTALSLMLVNIDRGYLPHETIGLSEQIQSQRLMEAACRRIDHPNMRCLAHGDDCLAVLLPDCGRRQAVELAGRWLDDVRRSAGHDASGDEDEKTRFAAGVATVSMPPKNFPAEDLLTAAGRCLYASHASGVGVAKSIEIY